MGTTVRNLRLYQNLSRLSPATLYSEAITTILTPEVRTLGPIFLEQVEGAIAGALPLGQSLLLIWPHLTGLVAATLICFAASYLPLPAPGDPGLARDGAPSPGGKGDYNIIRTLFLGG